MYKIVHILLLFNFGLLAQGDFMKLNGTDPSVTDDDLHQLAPFFENVKIVGMGESTHGTHEFFTMRFRMFQYLVNNHGFNTFFMEADYPNCLAINSYIQTGEGDPVLLIKQIGNWPWETQEMVDLITWMRKHNTLNPTNPITVIGIDAQKFQTTLTTLLELRAAYDLPALVLPPESAMTDTQFQTSKYDKKFEDLINILDQDDIRSFSEADQMKYQTLHRHLNQIIVRKKSKSSAYRDVKMGENILACLENNPKTKGFFWGHNMHIANWYTPKKEIGVAGGVVRNKIGKQYVSIGQEYNEGTFNVYHKVKEGSATDINNYELGPADAGPAPEGTFAYRFNEELDTPLFIPFSKLPTDEEVTMTNIGARYIPSNNPKSIYRYNHHGREAFDALILIKTSTPTHLLQ